VNRQKKLSASSSLSILWFRHHTVTVIIFVFAELIISSWFPVSLSTRLVRFCGAVLAVICYTNHKRGQICGGNYLGVIVQGSM